MSSLLVYGMQTHESRFYDWGEQLTFDLHDMARVATEGTGDLKASPLHHFLCEGVRARIACVCVRARARTRVCVRMCFHACAVSLSILFPFSPASRASELTLEAQLTRIDLDCQPKHDDFCCDAPVARD